jgi:hypothetical protein
MLDKNTLTGGILLVAIYIVVSQTLSTAIATAGISILLYAVTKSEAVILGFMLASLFIRDLNRLFIPRAPEPVGVEGFQARDAQSVHSRIEEVKNKAPVQHTVENVTGVLESPDILDNTPLMAMSGSDGVPGASIPASSKGRAMIHPVAEAFVPTPDGSIEKNPMENPFLQNGRDNSAVDASLLDTITNMDDDEEESSEIMGLTTDAAV